MTHVSLRRSLLFLPLLSLILGPSAASAAPLQWGNLLAEEGRSALRFLESALLGNVHASPRMPKVGCTINPDGQPQCAPAVTPKHGCGISPDGQPVCAPKHGCSINPNGQPQCLPAVTPKHGCSISPDGHTICTP